jgi:hypothetical protein
MPATYRAVTLAKEGGPDAVTVVDPPIEPPVSGQLRIKVYAQRYE